MRILAVDMGTGTQDILLFDSSGPVENSIKLVMPSATKIAEGKIRRATEARAAPCGARRQPRQEAPSALV